MSCQRCNSERILSVQGKCADRFGMWFGNNDYQDYVPMNIGIGGGDNIAMKYCLDCGQIQGEFPIERLEIEDPVDEIDEDEEND